MPAATRRRFLQGLAAILAASDTLPAGRGMKLSLSVRIAEAPGSKEKTVMDLDSLIRVARQNGYQALCMRASQAGIHTPPEAVREMQRKIRAAGLAVSMVTGDFPIVYNNAQGPQCLRDIAPYLDLAEAFGADLIRVCMKKDEDIPWAQRAADQARERSVRLAHQSHIESLFETVEGSLRVLRAVGRPNFGLIYEPANLLACGQAYGRETLEKFASHLFNVYVQNHRVHAGGRTVQKTWVRGEVRLDPIPLWEKGGVNFEEVFAGLAAVGYRGWVTVHQAYAEIMPPEEAAARSARYLKPLTR